MTQNINFPSIDVPITGATVAVENSDQRILFVGQTNPAAVAEELVQNIPNSEVEIKAIFGDGSMLSRMLIDARALNTVCQFDAVIVPDEAGAGALSNVAITAGTAVPGSEFTIVLESARYGTSTVIANSIDLTDEDQIAVALAALITANTNLNYTAIAAAGAITITSNSVNDTQDYVSIKVVTDDPSMTMTATKFGAGGPDPTTTAQDILNLIGEQRYQTIVWPYQDKVSVMTDLLDPRFNTTDDVLDGVAIVPVYGTLQENKDFAIANGSQSLVAIGNTNETGTATDRSQAILETPWSIAAQFGSIRALRRQPNANISQFVISRNGALDSIGGPAISSKPYANTPFSLLPIVPLGRGFQKSDIAQLANSGITVLGNNKANNGIIAGNVVTTYLTDPAGNPDISFKFLNYVDTASTGREYFFNNLALRYAQSRLTDGNLIKGRDITNEANIRAVMVGYYQTLADVDYVVARKGEDILQFFKNNLTVSVDLATGSVNIIFALPIVTQLRQIIAPMKLTFNIE